MPATYVVANEAALPFDPSWSQCRFNSMRVDKFSKANWSVALCWSVDRPSGHPEQLAAVGPVLQPHQQLATTGHPNRPQSAECGRQSAYESAGCYGNARLAGAVRGRECHSGHEGEQSVCSAIVNPKVGSLAGSANSGCRHQASSQVPKHPGRV